MARRFIYMDFRNKPLFRDAELFNMEADGTATGKLVEYLPALIRWALTCPNEVIEEFSKGGDSITAKLNPDSQIRTNPIRV
jgi:hypothetical protein